MCCNFNKKCFFCKKRKEDVPADQDKWRNVKDKLKYFSEKPGKGD